MVWWLLGCALPPADTGDPPVDTDPNCLDEPLAVYDDGPEPPKGPLMAGDPLQLTHGPAGGWYFALTYLQAEPFPVADVDVWITHAHTRAVIATSAVAMAAGILDPCHGQFNIPSFVAFESWSDLPVDDLACQPVELEATFRERDGAGIEVVRLPLAVSLDPLDRADPDDPCTPAKPYQDG